MPDTQEPEDERAELPKAIPVKRETLRKVQAEVMDLPVVEIHVLSPEPLAEEEKLEAEEEPAIEEEVQDEEEEVAPSSSSARGGSTLNRKALESTNRGKSIKSRRFVRGILHNSPFKVAFAAFFAILARVTFLGAIVLLILFLLDKVEAWTVWFVLIFPLAALFHIVSAHSARCRVCGQKEFLPSGARKHVKTHRFLFFGPIISTALHLLLFKWFRCMFCGTPVRIRK